VVGDKKKNKKQNKAAVIKENKTREKAVA